MTRSGEESGAPPKEEVGKSDGAPQEKVEKESQSSNKNNNNNRQRRRTNGNNDEVQSRSGSRHNSQSASKNNGGNRRDWGERKSMSQAGKNDNNKNGSSDKTNDDKRRTRSTNSTGEKSRRLKSTNSNASNGDGYELSDGYDDLDEPFSDSDDEGSRPRGPQKMSLNIPRGRIRTLSGTVPVVGFSPKWGGPTMCLSCLQFFDLPEQLEEFTEHLLKEHHIVVSEMGLIVDPKRYIEHWRQRFARESIDKIFPRVEPKEGEQFHGEVEFYFEMSEKLPEDYQLRQRLAMRRLEEALGCQQREREDTSFSLQCIFCRYKARGNRSKIIHHLYMIHHLNLGSPDNLVFVTEYIEHLKEKLDRNECIYCEKIFADRNTLMDHMRKRNHREVNPKNHYYDKFYIINYLELGKRWLDVLAEDFEDTMPTFVDSDEEEEDNSWCEWQEDNIDEEHRVLCLLCDASEESVEGLLDHMQKTHEYDFLKIIADNKLDVYQRMKFINFIRSKNYDAQCWQCGKDGLGNWLGLHKHLQEEHKPITELPPKDTWDTEENLVTKFGNDHLLWMLESHLELLSGAAAEVDEVDNRERRDKEKLRAQLVAESTANTVEGVVAEDLPELSELNIDELL